MNIIEAIEALRNGSSVIRRRWQDQENDHYTTYLTMLKHKGHEMVAEVTHWKKYGHCDLSEWDPGVEDVLADDWEVYIGNEESSKREGVEYVFTQTVSRSWVPGCPSNERGLRWGYQDDGWTDAIPTGKGVVWVSSRHTAEFTPISTWCEPKYLGATKNEALQALKELRQKDLQEKHNG